MEEKPLECTQCPNTIRVTYKEISRDTCSCMGMCPTCPMLEKKLRGTLQEGLSKNEITQLICPRCLTSLESMLMGSSLGCHECYSIFEEQLRQKFIKEKKLPSCFADAISDTPMHQGKSPHHNHLISLTHHLAVLNEDLNKAIEKEQYEQAAWLRDQIKEYKDKNW